MTPTPRLSRLEIRKDVIQGAVEAVAGTVGEVTTILTGAVRDVAASVGGLATELFELSESARRAAADADVDADEAAQHAQVLDLAEIAEQDREESGLGPVAERDR